jgi:hypothetical protein
MPEISRFYGIIIRMFYNDHNPPHFHVIYQDNEALIDINTLKIMNGSLPKRAKALAIEWAIEHRDELLANWQKARNNESLEKINPLD